ncbi:protein DOUBLE-STRAND BREAK FORMATION [Cornus florida]|uniref:protein DOUBLE-STRAND BREAK FORMATION n=1 Tax=Cornus florida TaxID=4283 RepID=UPI0028978961|nr:protein DOUBLE-STRAND BREAK FORMATION [Cornus florida]XP_059626429.1 protein DOUBLE-STRAND BREAK FORMATION [Cornus florida]
MSDRFGQQISLFRSQIEHRRFGDGTLRILESIMVSKDVKSLLEVRSSLRDFMRRESLRILHEITEKTVEHKLQILDFFVRAFALAGDVESCLALRYEALTLRELKSATNQWLQVSYREWMTFAEHSLDNGYYSIARKACENALSCFQMNGVIYPGTEEFFEHDQVIDKIKSLKDFAVASDASRSVQAQAAEYLEKKTVENSTKQQSKATPWSASTLFRNGVKMRNIRKFQEHQLMPQITSEPNATKY